MSEEGEVQAKAKARASAKSKGSSAKKVSKPAPAKVRREAAQVLDEKCAAIMKSLGEHAAKGNIPSARLLLELVEKPQGEPKKGKRGPSLAEGWSTEPEWPGAGADEG